ncbi:kinase-like domain-containing protein [Xylariaceae sp. FL0594]|nr:kinase-like domain-containing protein [Xylariaceae sp. FL0594]
MWYRGTLITASQRARTRLFFLSHSDSKSQRAVTFASRRGSPSSLLTSPTLRVSTDYLFMERSSSRTDAASDDGVGDYVDWDSDEADEIEINAEPIERYGDGCAYYPVRIGEVLGGRYRIVHKLGHGGFSTVWMADDDRENKAVALKILVSGKDGETEFVAQRRVKEVLGTAPHILTYHDVFDVPGLGADRHHILVMPLLGPSLDTHFRKASMAARMSAAKQLLVALNTVHKAGMVHRDLNLGAGMWQLAENQINQSDEATRHRLFGRPRKLDLSDKTWRPGDLVRPMTIPTDLIGNMVYLGDFGMVIQAGESVDFKPQTPAMYCAPERYHGQDPSFASDMWSYMCIFAALYLGFSPLYGPGGDLMAALWVDTLGPLPSSWKGTYRYLDSEGDDAWYDQTCRPHAEMCLESKLDRRDPIPDPDERRLVLSIFQKGFSYEPAQRISVGELLEYASFNALMAKYGCQESKPIR